MQFRIREIIKKNAIKRFEPQNNPISDYEEILLTFKEKNYVQST